MNPSIENQSTAVEGCCATPRELPPHYALLARVEALAERRSGAVVFPLDGDGEGLVLVDRGRLCWAASSLRGHRFADLLYRESAGRCDPDDLKALRRNCAESGLRFSPALVKSGAVSETELARALRDHMALAVVEMSEQIAGPPRFVAHKKGGYAPRFTFGSAEILARVGAHLDPEAALLAERELGRVLTSGGTGLAFSWTEALGPVAIAGLRTDSLSAREVYSIGRRAKTVLEFSALVCPTRELASATLDRKRHLVLWGCGAVRFAVLCEDPSLLALKMSAISGTLRLMRAADNLFTGGEPGLTLRPTRRRLDDRRERR